MKIRKEGCVSVFRGQRRKEKKKKKKKKKEEEERSRPASGGRRRQAADGCDRGRTHVDHRLEQRSSSKVSTRVARKPSRTATRAEPTGPADPRLREGGRAWQARCSVRLAPSRARGRALPACCWARERAWNGQFGPVVFCFLDFCPGSSSNTVFTWIGT